MYTHMHTHTCMHTYVHTYVRTHTHTHTHTHTGMHALTPTYICKHILVHIHTYTHVHAPHVTCIHTHACVHPPTHTHTHKHREAFIKESDLNFQLENFQHRDAVKKLHRKKYIQLHTLAIHPLIPHTNGFPSNTKQQVIVYMYKLDEPLGQYVQASYFHSYFFYNFFYSKCLNGLFHEDVKEMNQQYSGR